MAKKDNDRINPETAIEVQDPDDIERAAIEEDMSLADVLAIVRAGGSGLDPTEWEVGAVGAGAEYYWPAEPGMVIIGKLLMVDERMTSLVVDGKLSSARFYTIELTRPCMAVRTASGEMEEVPAGKAVSILERTVLRRLEHDIGLEVVVVCDGKGRTKRGLNLWRYRNWKKKVPTAQLGA